MSLLNSASLCVTPNGYKEGTLYSVIPNTTLGDMTVVRATTATRVNSAGLVELVPYNLLSYSEQFDNAIYTKGNVTATANSETAPNGTLTAETITGNGTSNLHSVIQNYSIVSGTTYTTSIYAKKGTNNFVQIVGSSVIYPATVFANFDLENGVVGSVGAATTSSIQSVGNGWYRCSMTATATATVSSAAFFVILINNASSSRAEVNTLATSVYLWGAQLVEGTLPKDYLRTETRLNIPRLDYSNGTCPSLLVEPQRTNLALYSSSFDNASWNKTNTTVTANTTTSPDGSTNADTLFFTASGGFHLLEQSLSLTSGTSYTQTYFVKDNGQNFVQIYASGVMGTTDYVNFNLTNSSISDYLGITGDIINYGNGWYRISATKTASSTGSGSLAISGIPTATSGRRPSYTGSGQSIYIWGAQLELGSYSTSYIPTQAATVTRNADAISKTGISSLINSVEGVLYAEISAVTNDGTFKVISMSDSSTSNVVRFYKTITDNQMSIRVTVAGVHQFNVVYTLPDSTANNKMALKYKANDFAFWVNGVEVATGTSGTTFTAGTLTELAFDDGSGAAPFYGKCQNLIVFPSALSDTELAQLTTL